MPYQATMPYRITILCGNCGYPLRVIKEGMGRGVYQLSLKKIHKMYGGRCPKCGKELDKKPKKVEFKTLKEASEYMNVDTKGVKITKLLTVRIPTWMDEAIKDLVKRGVFKSKTEFIVKAIMKMLEEHKVH
jgi:hypothetical protein